MQQENPQTESRIITKKDLSKRPYQSQLNRSQTGQKQLNQRQNLKDQSQSQKQQFLEKVKLIHRQYESKKQKKYSWCTCANLTDVVRIILAASLLNFLVWTVFLPILFILDVILFPVDLMLSFLCLPCGNSIQFFLGKINGISVFYLLNSIHEMSNVPFENRSWKKPIYVIVTILKCLTFIQMTIMYILHMIFPWKLGLYCFILRMTRRIDVQRNEKDEKCFKDYLMSLSKQKKKISQDCYEKIQQIDLNKDSKHLLKKYLQSLYTKEQYQKRSARTLMQIKLNNPYCFIDSQNT